MKSLYGKLLTHFGGLARFHQLTVITMLKILKKERSEFNELKLNGLHRDHLQAYEITHHVRFRVNKVNHDTQHSAKAPAFFQRPIFLVD